MSLGTDRPTAAERARFDCLDEMLLDLTTQRWASIPPCERTRALGEVCIVIQAHPDEAQRRWWTSELARSLQQAFPQTQPFDDSIKMHLAVMLRAAKEGFDRWRELSAPPLPMPGRK